MPHLGFRLLSRKACWPVSLLGVALGGCGILDNPRCDSLTSAEGQSLIEKTKELITLHKSEIADDFRQQGSSLPKDCCLVASRDSNPPISEVAPGADAAGFVVSITWPATLDQSGYHQWMTTYTCERKMIRSISV